MRLNIGCGRIHEKGDDWVNIDRLEEVEPDLVLDMGSDKWPYGTSSIEHVKALACLGQLHETEKFKHCLNEAWRVLKKDGTFWIYLPHKDFPHSYMDPYNLRHFNELSFQGMDVSHPQWHHNEYYGFKGWHVDTCETNDKGFLTVVMRPAK